MSEDGLETKIKSLRRELEDLSARQRQQLTQQDSFRGRKMQQMAERRTEILDRRIHELAELLRDLKRDSNPRSSGKDTSGVGHGAAELQGDEHKAVQ